MIKRVLAWAVYRRRAACFYCGHISVQPCVEHASGGTITVFQRRYWTLVLPVRAIGWVDPYWRADLGDLLSARRRHPSARTR